MPDERARELLANHCAIQDAQKIREGRNTLINSDRALKAIASTEARIVEWLRQEGGEVDHFSFAHKFANAIECGEHIKPKGNPDAPGA